MRRLIVPILLWIAVFGNIEVDGLAFRAFVPSDSQSMFHVLATRIHSIPESSLLLLMGVGFMLISRSVRRRHSVV
jgi:hypothetical protein